MSPSAGKTLLIGYGNPGRGDDGLGPEFARRIERHGLPRLSIEIDYQLTVDHAAMVATAATVIFADAAMDATSPFYFRPLALSSPQGLGSHSITPQSALALARILFGASSAGFLLGLGGVAFGEMTETMSDDAQRNLDLAEAFFLHWYARKPT
jgi:hydrogenase maturation protease